MVEQRKQMQTIQMTEEIDFRIIFESSPHPYLVLLPDQKFTILAVNESYLKITGKKREEILNKGLFEVFPDNPLDNTATGVSDLRISLERVIHDGIQDIMGIQKYDIRMEGKKMFEEKYWSPINTPVFDKNNHLVAIIHRVEEVTEFIKLQQQSIEGSNEEKNSIAIKKMESEILQSAIRVKEANRQLKDANVKLAKREEELSQLNKQLKELDIAKTKFFSNISHEFRTPLTLMLGPLEEALTESLEANPTLWHSKLEIAFRNALRLLKLVNNLLDFSKIETGRITGVFQPTDLCAFTQILVSMFRSAIEKANLKLIIHCPPLDQLVYVDREMWEKIVLNLISNAFKHTFEGEIEVKLISYSDYVELKVRDTGVGIPFEQLPNIFDRFHRVPNIRSRTFEGTGIGLALVKELVNLHSGKIKVNSIEDEGTTFTVSIPLGSKHLPKTQIIEESTSLYSLSGKKFILDEISHWLPEEERAPIDAMGSLLKDSQKTCVLFADDDEDIRKYVKEILEPFCDIRLESDGQAAFEFALRNPPDLILSDIMMPKMNGIEFLTKAKNHPQLKSIPFILLSAQAGEEAKVQGLELGADDYLVKPFKSRELLARIKANLNLDLQNALKQAEEAHYLSEQCFQMLFKQDFIGIAKMDLTGKFMMANEKYCKMIGRSQEELYQLRLNEIIHPDDLSSDKQFIENVVKDGSSLLFQKRYIRLDKSEIGVDNIISVIKDDRNQPRFLMIASKEKIKTMDSLR